MCGEKRVEEQDGKPSAHHSQSKKILGMKFTHDINREDIEYFSQKAHIYPRKISISGVDGNDQKSHPVRPQRF